MTLAGIERGDEWREIRLRMRGNKPFRAPPRNASALHRGARGPRHLFPGARVWAFLARSLPSLVAPRSMNPRFLIFVLSFGLSVAVTRGADNELTATEKKNGWQLLFDGKTM